MHLHPVLVLVLLPAFVGAYSTPKDVEPTTFAAETYDSSTAKMSVTDFPTSTEIDTTPDLATSTETDSLSTSTEHNIIDTTKVFVTNSEVEFSTTDYTSNSTTDGATTTASETTTTDGATTTASETATTDGATTTVSETTTTDGATTTASETTTIVGATTTASETTTTTDVSSTTGSTSTTTDIITSTAADTTTTVPISSTTAGATTSSDLDTTVAIETTTTTDFIPTSHNTTVTTFDVTLSTDAITVNYATGVSPSSTTDIVIKDDMKNYVIIALSIALGILIIGIIVWCVWSKVQRTDKIVPSEVKPYMKKNLVSTATQTDVYFPKGFNIRQVPPIDTHLELISEKLIKNPNIPAECTITDQIEIARGETQADDKINLFSETNCHLEANENETYISIPRGNGKISEDLGDSSETKKDNCKTYINNEPKPVAYSRQTVEGNVSSESESAEISFEEIFTMQNDGSSINFVSADRNRLGSTPENSKRKMSSLSAEEGVCVTASEQFTKSENAKDVIFVRTAHSPTYLKQVDGECIGSGPTNCISTDCTGLENKKQTFQIKHKIIEDEDVGEIIILLDPENNFPTKRHVTFKDTQEHKQHYNEERDNNVTLFGPGFRGLLNTKTNPAETASQEVRLKRKRKRSTRTKSALAGGIKSLTSPYLVQKRRYNATYSTIVNAFFNPERTEDKVWQKVKRQRRKIQSKTN